MFPGSGNSITITIGADNSGALSILNQTQDAVQRFGSNADNAGSQGFNAFQRFAITLSSITNLAQQAANALQPIVDVTENLVQQMFQLNVQTEKNVYAWQYLFGGKQNAASLAAWTAQFSMNVPFTRQDLMGAVSTLGTKFNMSQIEQYMPMLADLASTVGATAYGGKGINLSQAAYALIDLMMGRSQMFKMEFHIDPKDLIKYGLAGKASATGVHITDLSTLAPALQRYDVAHGYAGAAKGTAQNTWWGEWSSFIDRLQNFGLMAGGTDLNGNIRANSFFGEMKKALGDISSWMDSHQSQIQHFADIISTDLAGAFKTAADAAKGFLGGLVQSGLLEGLGLGPTPSTPHPTGTLKNTMGKHHLLHGLVNAENQNVAGVAAPPASPWQQFGEIVGNVLQTLGNDIHTVQSDIQSVVGWFNTWHDVILTTAGVITGVFVPAMVKAGVQAVISGALVAGKFVASIIKTGVEGIVAADKLLAFIGNLILTGVQAVVNGAKIVASFVASLIQAGARAVATGATMLASLVPAIISTTADFIVMAATGIASAITGFIAYIPVALAAAAATLAATWPVLLIIGAIAAFVAIIILLATHWTQVTTALGHFKDWVGKELGDAFGWIGGKIGDLLGTLGKLKDWLGNEFQTAWKNIGDFISKIWTGLGDAVKSGINDMIGLINKFIGFIDSIHIHIPAVQIAGHGSPAVDIGFNIPPIPQLAEGGRIARAGMAIVGERGPERVWLGQGAVVEPHGGFGPSTTHRYGDHYYSNTFHGLTEPMVRRIVADEFSARNASAAAGRRAPGGGMGGLFSGGSVGAGWGAGKGSW